MQNVDDAYFTTTSMPVSFHWDAAIKSVATIHENGEIFPFISASEFSHTEGVAFVTELNELINNGTSIFECFIIVDDTLNKG